jgi:hypothetical protein
MRPRAIHRPFSLALIPILIFLVSTAAGHATDGRDFAGVYAVTNVADLGDAVQVTLSVHLHNYSDADLSEATVSVRDSAASDVEFGSFAGLVSIPDRASARLSGSFLVSPLEYGRWLEGQDPSLWIQFLSATGEQTSRSVQVIPGLVEEENQP